MFGILAVLVLVVTCLTAALIALYISYRRIKKRYAPIIDMEALLSEAEKELYRIRSQTAGEAEEGIRRKEELSAQYLKSKEIYERLQREISLLEENVEDISFGLYKPHFNFDSSDQYRLALQRNHGLQKAMIKNNQAAVSQIEWTVGNSKAEGARMTMQYLKLLVRAFNGECDAAVAKVSWNNVVRMEERIKKSYEAINKTGATMQMSITPDYLRAKLDELRLTYEETQKKHEEQEEQKRIREQMRDEEKAVKEAEKARREAENEEQRFEKALEQAREEAARTTGAEMEKLSEKIREMERQLEEAHAMKERAKSLAEQTRSGHVYIISNIGSFGDQVLKIGMTRRLDPMDRVKELGDASVPFQFDVHAMIYSHDAPSLENELHKHFDDRRVNMINQRKEFFFVDIDEIENFARERNLTINLTKLAEAREYRETLSMKEKSSEVIEENRSSAERFPDSV